MKGKIYHTGKIFQIVLLLLYTQILWAQGASAGRTLDSLRNALIKAKGEKKIDVLIELSAYYWEINPDSSLIYADLLLQEAKRDGSNEALGDAFNAMGNAFYYKNQPEQAIHYYEKSKYYREKTDNHEKIGHTYNNLGLLYSDLKQYNMSINAHTKAAEEYSKAKSYSYQVSSLISISNIYNLLNEKNKALEFAFKALSIVNEHNLTRSKASIYNTIGAINRDLKNLDLAEKYYTLAFSDWEMNHDTNGLSSGYNNLGIIFDEKGELEKSLIYYNKSLELTIKLGDSIGMATAFNNIGYLYARINEPNKAINAYKKSMEIFRKYSQIEDVFNTQNNIAAIHLKTGNPAKAEKYLNQNLQIINKVTNLTFIQETYHLLSSLYSMKGNYRKAYEYKSIELAYADSLYTQQKLSSIAEVQTRYETEGKEKEIQLLKKDVELKELQYQKQKSIQQVLIVLTLLLIVIFIGSILTLSIIRKKKHQLAEKNKELNLINKRLKESEENLKELNATKDKLFSIIAHDLKNPFNALIGFSDILERNFTYLTDGEKKEYISVISDSSQNLYKLLDNLLQWTRTQTGTINYMPERFKIDSLIKQEITNLNANAEKKKINISLNAESKFYVYADKNSIATVVRNLISNAIKFTDIGGQIDITITESTNYPNMAEVIIKDSGVGIDEKDLPKIFMIDGSFSTKGTANESGTGLGLLLCHEFVTKNNGKIWVTSVKDKGSSFYFTLPA